MNNQHVRTYGVSAGSMSPFRIQICVHQTLTYPCKFGYQPERTRRRSSTKLTTLPLGLLTQWMAMWYGKVRHQLVGPGYTRTETRSSSRNRTTRERQRFSLRCDSPFFSGYFQCGNVELRCSIELQQNQDESSVGRMPLASFTPSLFV